MALGERAVQSDFKVTFEGYEDLWVLIRTAQTPAISRGDNVEDFGPFGMAFQQYGNLKRDGDISANIVEVKSGRALKAIRSIVEDRQYINVKVELVGEGQKGDGWELQMCTVQAEPGDLDVEGQTTALRIPLQIHHNWFEWLK